MSNEVKNDLDATIIISKCLYNALLETICSLNRDDSLWWCTATNLMDNLKEKLKQGTISPATYQKSLTVLDECGMVPHSGESDDEKEESA